MKAPSRPGASEQPVPPVEISQKWVDQTVSPQPIEAQKIGDVSPLYAACGTPDEGLARLARMASELQVAGRSLKDSDLKLLLRAGGAPYLWPRVFSVLGADLEPAELEAKVSAWAEQRDSNGQTRCGIARDVIGPGQSVVSVVAVEVLADVEPLPIRARVGEWVTFAAKLHQGSTPEVFLQGPRGRPRRVISNVKGNRVTARFALSEPGAYTLQVIATLPQGPMPVTEAMLFADVDPPSSLEWPLALGEAKDDPSEAPARRMLYMLNGAREQENLKPLKLDSTLSRLAQEHADAMRAQNQLGHDVGQGSPKDRLVRAGLSFRQIGENVAMALSLPRAHRALWSSPSHRFTMLHPDFDRVGIGVSVDQHGSYWVAELFAGK